MIETIVCLQCPNGSAVPSWSYFVWHDFNEKSIVKRRISEPAHNSLRCCSRESDEGWTHLVLNSHWNFDCLCFQEVKIWLGTNSWHKCAGFLPFLCTFYKNCIQLFWHKKPVHRQSNLATVHSKTTTCSISRLDKNAEKCGLKVLKK